MKLKPETYLSMVETAEGVGDRYNISRDVQVSQHSTAAAQEAGKFDDEIIPVATAVQVC